MKVYIQRDMHLAVQIGKYARKSQHWAVTFSDDQWKIRFVRSWLARSLFLVLFSFRSVYLSLLPLGRVRLQLDRRRLHSRQVTRFLVSTAVCNCDTHISPFPSVRALFVFVQTYSLFISGRSTLFDEDKDKRIERLTLILVDISYLIISIFFNHS
jgi:hypothetical protein